MMRQNIPAVAVLMSTYNGEKYLREQLDSIFLQEKVRLTLFVRDDGSVDRTVKILEEYATNHPIILWKDPGNVGPGESFLRLLRRYAHEPGFDFFAFSDQDDIWLENKLSVAVEQITNCEVSGPILYSSNQLLYINEEVVGLRHKNRQSVDLIPRMSGNTIAGCTFVMNRALAILVANADMPAQKVLRRRIHDTWVLLTAIVCGYVIYDETAYIWYRIHQDNAVGIRKITFFGKMKRLQEMLMKSNDPNLRMNTAKELLRLYPDMHPEAEAILSLYANYQNSLKDKFRLLRNREIIENCLENKIIFRLKILMNFL